MEDGKVSALYIDKKDGSVALAILQGGLVGWENRKDHDGQPVPFTEIAEDGKCPLENIETIHPDDRLELANAIDQGNRISEDDAKK